jgi:signal transduction histidine kinase
MVQVDASAQSDSELGLPLISNYTSKIYKGHSQVWSVIQDDRGIMYFGTTSGITEFDGVNWKQIKLPGVSGNAIVRSMGKDKNGVIYYGTVNEFGYLSVNEFGNTVAVSLTHLIPEEAKEFSVISSIQNAGDNIYFFSSEYLFRIKDDITNPEKELKILKAETAFLTSFKLNEEIYVNQREKGLCKFIDDDLVLIPGGEFLTDNRALVLLPYANGLKGEAQFLLPTTTNGIFIYDGKNFKKLTTDIDEYLKTGLLYRGILLQDGNYMIAINGRGAFVITPAGKLIQKINSDIGIQDDSIYALYLDSSGLLWFGMDNGIAKIEFNSFLTRFARESGIKSAVLSITRSNGTLYVGTTSGVFFLNPKKRRFELIPETEGSQIFTLIKDDKNLIVPTPFGLGEIKLNTSGMIKVSNPEIRPLSYKITKNNEERLWLSSNSGISVFKRNTKPNEFSWVQEGNLLDLNYGVYSLAEHKDGSIWAGTHLGFAYKLTPKWSPSGELSLAESKLEIFGFESGLENGPGAIYSVNGEIYSLTEDGLVRYSSESGKFEKTDVFGEIKIDFSSTDNFSLFEDNTGKVWISINNKIRVANPLPNGGYTLEDNLFSAYPGEDIITIFPENNGVVWVGSGEGLFRMEGQIAVDKAFQVLLRQVATKEDTLSVSKTNQGTIKLKNRNNSLKFEYASPFYEQEERTVYQTYLEGFDKDWSPWNRNSFREYTNLPSGQYSFKVRAKNLYNVISDEATYTFTILPPWYATWWAYLVYLLILGFLIFLIDKFQRRRLLAKLYTQNREKELAQAKEIQKAYENLKATQEQLIQQEKLASLGQLTAGIAHEIKNPLNFVNNFSELSMEYIEEIFEEMEKLEQSDVTDDIRALLNDVKSNLSKILQHGSRADGIVKSMLMHSRGGKGIMEPTDLNELVKEYVNLAFHGMRANKNPINVDIKLQLDENLPKVKINPEDFSRVILNLCKNAFDAMRDKTYENPNGYLPKLTVRTKDLDDNLILEVEDNGPGIAEEFRDKLLMPFFTTKKGTEGTGLGLSITHDIVKAHEGTLEINSEVGNFTRFSIMLKKE